MTLCSEQWSEHHLSWSPHRMYQSCSSVGRHITRLTLTISRMSDSQQSELGACVSAELIEGVLMTFAQRPFQRGSGYCVAIPPRPGTNFDHLSCEWCEGPGMKDEPLQLYRSIGHHQVFSQASSTAAPDDSFDNPVVGHPTCMIYNTDPDKIASRLAESK